MWALPYHVGRQPPHCRIKQEATPARCTTQSPTAAPQQYHAFGITITSGPAPSIPTDRARSRHQNPASQTGEKLPTTIEGQPQNYYISKRPQTIAINGHSPCCCDAAPSPHTTGLSLGYEACHKNVTIPKVGCSAPTTAEYDTAKANMKRAAAVAPSSSGVEIYNRAAYHSFQSLLTKPYHHKQLDNVRSTNSLGSLRKVTISKLHPDLRDQSQQWYSSVATAEKYPALTTKHGRGDVRGWAIEEVIFTSADNTVTNQSDLALIGMQLATLAPGLPCLDMPASIAAAAAGKPPVYAPGLPQIKHNTSSASNARQLEGRKLDVHVQWKQCTSSQWMQLDVAERVAEGIAGWCQAILHKETLAASVKKVCGCTCGQRICASTHNTSTELQSTGVLCKRTMGGNWPTQLVEHTHCMMLPRQCTHINEADHQHNVAHKQHLSLATGFMRCMWDATRMQQHTMRPLLLTNHPTLSLPTHPSDTGNASIYPLFKANLKTSTHAKAATHLPCFLQGTIQKFIHTTHCIDITRPHTPLCSPTTPTHATPSMTIHNLATPQGRPLTLEEETEVYNSGALDLMRALEFDSISPSPNTKDPWLLRMVFTHPETVNYLKEVSKQTHTALGTNIEQGFHKENYAASFTLDSCTQLSWVKKLVTHQSVYRYRNLYTHAMHRGHTLQITSPPPYCMQTNTQYMLATTPAMPTHLTNPTQVGKLDLTAPNIGLIRLICEPNARRSNLLLFTLDNSAIDFECSDAQTKFLDAVKRSGAQAGSTYLGKLPDYKQAALAMDTARNKAAAAAEADKLTPNSKSAKVEAAAAEANPYSFDINLSAALYDSHGVPLHCYGPEKLSTISVVGVQCLDIRSFGLAYAGATRATPEHTVFNPLYSGKCQMDLYDSHMPYMPPGRAGGHLPDLPALPGTPVCLFSFSYRQLACLHAYSTCSTLYGSRPMRVPVSGTAATST